MRIYMLLNTNQTKILVLYILDVANCPMPLHTTNDIIAMCDINGFTIMEALSELTEQGTIEQYTFEGEPYIQPTVSAKNIVDAIGKEIPLSVREKASVYTMREIAKMRKKLGVSTSIRQDGDDFYVTVSINDNGLVLYKAELYAPTKEQAVRMGRSFESKPYEIYGKLIESLTEMKDYTP